MEIHSRGDIMVDLCPKCTEAFKLFMEGRIDDSTSTEDIFRNVNRLYDPMFTQLTCNTNEEKENKNEL